MGLNGKFLAHGVRCVPDMTSRKKRLHTGADHNFAVGVMNKLVSAVDKYSWINNDDVHTRKTP